MPAERRRLPRSPEVARGQHLPKEPVLGGSVLRRCPALEAPLEPMKGGAQIVTLQQHVADPPGDVARDVAGRQDEVERDLPGGCPEGPDQLELGPGARDEERLHGSRGGLEDLSFDPDLQIQISLRQAPGQRGRPHVKDLRRGDERVDLGGGPRVELLDHRAKLGLWPEMDDLRAQNEIFVQASG